MGLSRRNFVWRLGGLMLAAGAPIALSPKRLLAAVTPSEPGSEMMASVTGVSAAGVRVANETRVFVTEGFPDGWSVEVGDHVALMPSLRSSEAAVLPAADTSAFPVVHWTTQIVEPAKLAPGYAMPGDPSLKLDHGAVLWGDSRRDAATAMANICIVDRDGGPGLDRVISVRW